MANNFEGPGATRNILRGLIRDRAGAVAKVLPVLRECAAVGKLGKDKVMSLAGAGATKENGSQMLRGIEIATARWKSVLQWEVLGKKEGHNPYSSKLWTFRPQNTEGTSQKGPKKATYAQLEWKSASLVAREVHSAFVEALKFVKGWAVDRRNKLVLAIGAVLPMAMATVGGGARKSSKSKGINNFISTHFPDVSEGGRFYDAEAQVIDLATELHRTPGVTVLAKGGLAPLEYLRKNVIVEHASCRSTAFVGVCYDAPHLVPPIKAHEQAGRRANTGTSAKRFDPTSKDPLPSSGGFQSFLRSFQNRDSIAAHVAGHFLLNPLGKGSRSDITYAFCGVPRFRSPVQDEEFGRGCTFEVGAGRGSSARGDEVVEPRASFGGASGEKPWDSIEGICEAQGAGQPDVSSAGKNYILML